MILPSTRPPPPYSYFLRNSEIASAGDTGGNSNSTGNSRLDYLAALECGHLNNGGGGGDFVAGSPRIKDSAV